MGVDDHRKQTEGGLQRLGEQIAGNDEPAPKPKKRRRHAAAHARPRPRRARKLKWTAGILALVLVLLVGAVAGYGWYLNHEIHRIKIKDLSAAPKVGVDLNTENILMIGSTSRCALAQPNPAYGLCSQGVNGVNSDVVMILHLDPATHAVSILSIPRDLFVPNARAEGANKIDAALYEGPTQLIAAIQEDFGIPIQHFVELNFDSFINIVNDLGGIKMYFPEEVYDAYSGLNIQQTGCLDLDGTVALQVVRARHLQYKGTGVTSDDPVDWPQEAQSDIARIRRDHEFLRVLASAIQKRGLSNPLVDQQLIAGVVGQLTVDQGFSATDMLNLVLAYHSVNVNAAPELTIPVAVDQFGDYDYEGSDYGDIEFPAEPQDHQAIDQFLGLSADDDTFSGGTLPAPSSVTVAVMNGSGAYDLATDTADGLQALGFHIGAVGDTTPVGQQAETVVYYSSVSRGELAAAQTVANALSGAVILAYDPSQVAPGSQVTVVAGTNFSVNAPTPPPTSTTGAPSSTRPTTPTTSTTTTTTFPTDDGEFAPPHPDRGAAGPLGSAVVHRHRGRGSLRGGPEEPNTLCRGDRSARGDPRPPRSDGRVTPSGTSSRGGGTGCEGENP